MKPRGFTIIETIIIIVFVSALSALIIIQKTNLDAMHRDETRKTALNSMYYSLEEYFYKQNNYYPESISPEVLPTVAPELWTDPDEHEFSTPESEYIYEPANCHQGHCSEYTLKAILEKESNYIRTNNTN